MQARATPWRPRCFLDKVRYPVGLPFIGDLERARVAQTLLDGQLTQGPTVARFEETFAEWLGVRNAVACSSGTAALHLALRALGIGPGDEVLVPDLSFVATANAVVYCGATPVLVDVDAATWNISLTDADRKIGSRTKAIVPVHLYGLPCDMDAMRWFADAHDIAVVEDAAEALGGNWKGQPCGTQSACGTFSFYANKILTTGEGGAVVTNDDELAASLRLFRGQWQSPNRRYWHAETGFNYRMTDVHASIGLAQFERIDWLLAERLKVVQRYRQLLHFLESPTSAGQAPWLFTALLPKGVSFTRAAAGLLARGVETRPVFVPMHRLPMFERPDGQFPEACRVSDAGISLPTYPGLTDDDVAFISAAVLEVVS